MTRKRLAFTALFLVGGCSPAAPVDVAVEAVTQCPGTAIAGNDVSNYQGSIDWGAVQGSGRRFMIAKATEGTGYIDPQFKAN